MRTTSKWQCEMDAKDRGRPSGRDASMTEWLPLVRAEFNEMPGMHLTRRQMQRLFGLTQETCDAVVEALVQDHFLRRTANDELAKVDRAR